MTKRGDVETPFEPTRGPRLTRRSLVAAGALLATLAPGVVSRALATDHRHGYGYKPKHKPRWKPKPWHKDGDGDGQNGVVCFLRGTLLLTPEGEVAIEELKIGDEVMTLGGDPRAIRWIGRLGFTRETSSWSEAVRPVRISKDALAVGSPKRDLYVSGAHMLYLNGVLISASSLVNGTTVSHVAPDVDTLQYFHVEFDTHEVVLAEGAPCESLLATAERRQIFDNYEEHVALYGEFATADMIPFAPIASFNGGRSEFKSRLRSALAPVIDLRRPIDVVRDHVEARALLSKAA